MQYRRRMNRLLKKKYGQNSQQFFVDLAIFTVKTKGDI